MALLLKRGADTKLASKATGGPLHLACEHPTRGAASMRIKQIIRVCAGWDPLGALCSRSVSISVKH